MLHSLRSRLIVLLALALLPASTLAVVQAVSNYRQVKALNERTLLQSSAIVAAEEKNVILDARDLLEDLTARPEIAAFVPGPCGQTLLRVQKESREYDHLVVVRSDGSLACSTSVNSEDSFASDEWFLRTIASEAFTITGNITLPDSDDPTLMTTLPLRDRSGKLVGIVGLALRQAWLEQLVRQPEGESLANTSVALLDRRGAVLVESTAGDARRAEWMPAAFVIGTRLSGKAQVFQTEGRDGIERIFALAPLYENQVFIVLGGVSGHLLASPSWQLIAGLAYPILMWVIAIAVAWFAVDRLVLKQVLRLRKTANAYAEGHFEVRTPGIEDAPQEIRELGMTMHKMADVISLHEGELRKSLQEQKALLKEVYHRVKNNLQIVSSLVNLQVSRADNDHERTALRTTQDRIHALSMVHSNLYETPELHQIKLQEFVPQLCDYLRQAQGETAENVRMAFDIYPIRSDPERAVPLALLITEVVTNAMKHGWPDGQSGQLSITLRDQDGGLEMVISDDASTTELSSPESLGGRLIHAFARQLGGTIQIDVASGFRLTLKVPPKGA